jgi:DNA-binding transcriptional LysR family regulator
MAQLALVFINLNRINKHGYMIQLARLEGFYWVARTGGYARAAREFPYPITQPGVHQQVRKLEAELGTALFARVGKDRMMLTEAGRALFDFCAPFFEGLPPLVQAIEQGRVAGQLRIDAASLEISQILPKWLKRVCHDLPDVQLLVEEITQLDYGRLRSGKTDLIVEYQPSPPADVATTRVGTYHSFLVAPHELLPESMRRPQLRDLKLAPFASFLPGSIAHALQLDALRRAGCTPSTIINASSVSGILGFVESGLCYSVVPWADARGPQLRGVRTVKATGPNTKFAVSAAYRRDDQSQWLRRVLRLAGASRVAPLKT